jgi:ABC-type transport system substrate-binding protein
VPTSAYGTKRTCRGRLTTRIANTAGDSVLAEFGSAVDAVQCAVDAQVAENPKIEALRDAYVRTSSSSDEQKKIAAEIQTEAYDQLIYTPLGQYRVVASWRKSLSGVLDGPATPVFWNIDKSE